MSERERGGRRSKPSLSGPPGPAPSLLVFDWDARCWIRRRARRLTRVALQDAGFPIRRRRPSAGRSHGLRDSAAMFFPNGTRAFQRWSSAIASLLETYKDAPLLFGGAAAALRELGARGHLLAVATAKGRRGLVRELESTGLLPLLHASRTVDECPPKPHPGMLLELMAELGALPEQTLMIGDTTYDLEMAANAGVRAVGVLSGSHCVQDLEPHRPLALLASVADIPRWLVGE